MTFGESIQTCFIKYADFNGRASRSEFWWFALFLLLVGVGAQVIGDTAISLVSLATLLPSIAVTTRRLHDIDRSGWWQLIVFVPVVGLVLVIYWCVLDSTGPNRYDQAEGP